MAQKNITITSEHDILRKVVKDYPGILSASEPLFEALNQSPKNWDTIVKETRTYALKNFYLHDHHEKGTEAIKVIVDIFIESLKNPDNTIQILAVENLLFYIEKILIDGDNSLGKYAPILQDCFARLNQLDENQFFFLLSNPRQLKKLGQIILAKMPSPFDLTVFNELLFRYFMKTYEYWLREKDPSHWVDKLSNYPIPEQSIKNLGEVFSPLSHKHIHEFLTRLNDLRKVDDQYSCLKELIQLPGYMQLVKFYEELTTKISVTGDLWVDLNLKILYLLMIMDTKGLSGIHENTLREINRVITKIITIGEPEQIEGALSDVIDTLRINFSHYPDTTLYCIQNIGIEIYNKNDSGLVEWYLQKIISLGFQYPDIQGVTDEWQVKSNRTHLQNIRIWLDLLEINPKWSKSLISALIINLRLSGIHISDTDIFQKDVTKLLNSDINPVYHLVKQLAKIFPVYFSEIGAEGPLRDVSTEIDELTYRNDVLIHFLRKQSHVESSSRVVHFIEGVLLFWLTLKKEFVREFLPDHIYQQIKVSGSYIDQLNIIFTRIFQRLGISDVRDLLSLTDEEILTLIQDIPYVSDREKKRAYLGIRFYQLLSKKYTLDPQDMKDHLRHAQSLGLPNTDSLITVLEEGTVAQRLDGILKYLEVLKKIILAPEKYEPIENIFRKRHIAAGIPSIYGKYHERKFDALALTFRLESLANILFEELISSLNLKFITRAALFQIEKYVNLFSRALKLDGISSNKLENALELLSVALEVRRFSFSQYIDIFRGFSDAMQDIITTYYSNIFKNNLKSILAVIGNENILPKYLQKDTRKNTSELINMISEQFLRETFASSFGLQQLDNFISRILKTLFEQAEGLDFQNLDLLMSYDPKKALSGIHFPNIATNDRIHLGNKGHNLIQLASLGIPVPPGFIITTEVFRCKKAINQFSYAKEHLEEGIEEHISNLEKQTGKLFGKPENPLLVSVRSGGAISMPGMMLSFLNVGINEDICNGLIRQTSKPWFVWDCYRRFLQGWGMSYGMERDQFDYMMNSHKSKYHVLKKIQFSPEQMRELALRYRETIRGNGIEIIDDPEIQLRIAIEQVFNSWHSKKAQAYREILGISESWGTAVIVQAMVYGNLDTNSGTGVLFTRNPQESGDRVRPWGDFATGAQGEDIVSGLVKTLPLSNEQKPIEDRLLEVSLEDSFPELFSTLLKISKDLIYTERWSAQEIEFTFERQNSDSLYILQTRDMAITMQESFMAFMPSKKLSSSYLSRGIGVGGGALSGRVVFDLDEIEELRGKDPSTPLILIRSDTVPDDIRHISAADGLLTALGGSTSHASIIANRLGKTCVVGCNNLIVWEEEKKCELNKKLVKVGDFLSIDGRNGSVYFGKHEARVIKAGSSTKL